MQISINITQRRAQVLGSPVLVCGNTSDSITFNFDSEWSTNTTRTARFVYIQQGEVKYTDVIFTGNKVSVPLLSDTREVRVGVFAGALRTTTPACIPCEPSILCGTGAPVDPTPSQYDQIMALLSKVEMELPWDRETNEITISPSEAAALFGAIRAGLNLDLVLTDGTTRYVVNVVDRDRCFVSFYDPRLQKVYSWRVHEEGLDFWKEQLIRDNIGLIRLNWDRGTNKITNSDDVAEQLYEALADLKEVEIIVNDGTIDYVANLSDRSRCFFSVFDPRHQRVHSWRVTKADDDLYDISFWKEHLTQTKVFNLKLEEDTTLLFTGGQTPAELFDLLEANTLVTVRVLYDNGSFDTLILAGKYTGAKVEYKFETRDQLTVHTWFLTRNGFTARGEVDWEEYRAEWVSFFTLNWDRGTNEITNANTEAFWLHEAITAGREVDIVINDGTIDYVATVIDRSRCFISVVDPRYQSQHAWIVTAEDILFWDAPTSQAQVKVFDLESPNGSTLNFTGGQTPTELISRLEAGVPVIVRVTYVSGNIDILTHVYTGRQKAGAEVSYRFEARKQLTIETWYLTESGFSAREDVNWESYRAKWVSTFTLNWNRATNEITNADAIAAQLREALSTNSEVDIRAMAAGTSYEVYVTSRTRGCITVVDSGQQKVYTWQVYNKEDGGAAIRLQREQTIRDYVGAITLNWDRATNEITNADEVATRVHTAITLPQEADIIVNDGTTDYVATVIDRSRCFISVVDPRYQTVHSWRVYKEGIDFWKEQFISDDVALSSGTDGDWTYKRWSSGTFECSGQVEVEVIDNGTFTSEIKGVVGTAHLPGAVVPPSGGVTVDSVIATAMDVGALGVCALYSGDYLVFGVTSFADQKPGNLKVGDKFSINCEVKGRWQ